MKKVIPKIIHQIWEGRTEPLPEIFARLSESWKAHYPGWAFEFWDGKRMDTFVETCYPQYAEMYQSFPYAVQRWDAIRYLILYKMGGMYVDFDYESLEPLDELVKDNACCFAVEPELHGRSFGKPMVFNNALMLSIPGHPFMQKIVETVFSASRQKSITKAMAIHAEEKKRKPLTVFNSTGPWMLVDLYEQLSETEKAGVYLIPDKYVSPLNANQARKVMQGIDFEEYDSCLAEAYAVHYFCGIWLCDLE